MMTGCGLCHRSPEGRGGLRESQWTAQAHGLSLEGQVGIGQDEKVKGTQVERTAGAKVWQGDLPTPKCMA